MEWRTAVRHRRWIRRWRLRRALWEDGLRLALCVLLPVAYWLPEWVAAASRMLLPPALRLTAARPPGWAIWLTVAELIAPLVYQAVKATAAGGSGWLRDWFRDDG
ncbi:protein of unknown function [Candidatus Hydrogenisulfobacillus filiaventi]|uniref:Uncharacterized protein n=1 Tax=Candidatus Hydrogenisulfobacillus filiaventi TaxID=2707344 RepID=A0A6F8ZHK9_9FIRM|nr:protein of unknown function [Candidatus Hydrogenisulfobacillus filiaventi]